MKSCCCFLLLFNYCPMSWDKVCEIWGYCLVYLVSLWKDVSGSILEIQRESKNRDFKAVSVIVNLKLPGQSAGNQSPPLLPCYNSSAQLFPLGHRSLLKAKEQCRCGLCCGTQTHLTVSSAASSMPADLRAGGWNVPLNIFLLLLPKLCCTLRLNRNFHLFPSF